MKNVIFPRFIRMDGTAAGVRIPVLRRLFNAESLVNGAAAVGYGLLITTRSDLEPATPYIAAGISFLSLSFAQATTGHARAVHFTTTELKNKYIDTRPPHLGVPTPLMDGVHALWTHHIYKAQAIRNTMALGGMLMLAQLARFSPLSHQDVNLFSAGLALCAAASAAQHAIPARRFFKIATGQWTLRENPPELCGMKLTLPQVKPT